MKALMKTAMAVAAVAATGPALAQADRSARTPGYNAPAVPYVDPRGSAQGMGDQRGEDYYERRDDNGRRDDQRGDSGRYDDRGADNQRYDDRRYARGNDRVIRDAAGRINDPRTQRAVGNAMAAMVDAMLDIRLDGIRNAVAGIDPRGSDRMRDRDGRQARTLRDVVERNDPYFSRRIQSEAMAATRGVGAASQAAVDIAPELRRAAERVARSVDEAVRRAR